MQDQEKIRDIARTVIEIEAKMISSLLDRIDNSFSEACRLLLECDGKVIVMGMGKSGHIANKIAATFASTGTPSFFIHPGEAKHGDFGMITAKDAVILISNSGETEEILCILPFIKSLNIPLIALTGKPRSTLAEAATIHIDVSVSQEACPLGLAPTSSTTAALVMGDALAITLLKNRGFTAEDFARSHPGGSLGRRLLLRVEDLMHKEELIPKIDANAILKAALIEISQKKLGMTTVTQNNTLVGILTDGDLRRAFDNNANIYETPVHAVMTKTPQVISSNTLAADALTIMNTKKITALIITNEHNHPIGVIHLHDILRAGVM